ncbi:MAG: hypothetical protein IPM29_29975 [Planctomycetes bacterium]|nr:hypothetical protein [Planctomycetota bacterium]
MRFDFSILATSLLAAGVAAQGGLGAHVQIGTSGSNQLDVSTAATSNMGYAVNGALGVSVDPNGTIWVTARRNTASTANPHKLIEFDANGNFVNSYDQPTGTLGSAWGIRDMAWDGDFTPNSRIYGGCEHASTANTVFAWDWTNKVWDPTRNIVLPTWVNNTARALAVCPPSHPAVQAQFPTSPLGVLVHTNWSGVVEWFDIASGTAAQPATPSPNNGAYGAYFNANDGTVTLFGQLGGPRATDGVTFVTIDLTGAQTGQKFLGDLSVPGTNPGGIAGGAEWNPNFANNFRGEVTYLTQANNDTVVRVQGDYNYGSMGCLTGSTHSADGYAYVGNAAYNVTLDGVTTGTSAFLAYGVAGPTINPLPFILNCGIDLGLSVFGLIGPIAVTGGAAQQTFNLSTAPANVSVSWQWLVPNASGRIDLSRAGSTYISQ